jgi:hypothetical protein
MLEFTESEEEAITAGGQEAGAYLDSIGKTDLADLGGYSNAMRETARSNPPF